MDIEQAKRYSLAELTLLGIFVIGLAAAWLIVQVRGKVELTESIVLDGSGLSVSLPQGGGWEHTPAWIYESDNSMALLAQHSLMDRADVELRWRFIFGAQQVEITELLKQRLGGSIAQVQPIESFKDSFMKAASVSTPGLNEPTYYLAMANLDYGRRLELQVIPKTANFDQYYAESLLRDTAASVVYNLPQELKAGKELLSQYFETFTVDGPLEELYLITDERSRAVGYYRMVVQQISNGADIWKIENNHFDMQQFKLQSTVQIGKELEPFAWQTQLTVRGAGARKYEITIDSGTLTVNSNVEKDRLLYPSGYILPELLAADFVKSYLKGGSDAIVVELLGPMGQFVPARIQQIPAQSAAVKSSEISSAVRIEYLHMAGFQDELYYNEQGQSIGRFERQPNRPDRIWTKSDLEELRHVFQGSIDF